MRSLLPLLLLLVVVSVLSSAFENRDIKESTISPVDSTINNCNLNLLNAVFNIDSLTGSNAIIYGKYNAVYKDVEYIGCNGVTNTFCKNDSFFLKYYVYYPKNHDYTSAPLPALVMFHGGGFSDCYPTEESVEFSRACAEFAKRGFVVFNVTYRTGSTPDYVDQSFLSAQQVLATYRSIQDGRGALRSIIKRERNRRQFNDPFILDTNKIFLGGESAGSFIALNLAYYQTQAQEDAVSPGVKEALGSINADYYYGDTTINYFRKIKGVVNMWGNILLPLNALPDPSAFFASNINPPPAISFHGMLDSIAPYGITNIYFSPNKGLHTIFNSEGNCLLTGKKFKLYPKTPGPDIYASGSENIYNFLRQHNIAAELYLDCQMQHGLDDIEGLTFDSDFGTGFTSKAMVYNYIVQRAAIFFQAVVNNTASGLGTTKFIDCQNNRIRCNMKNNNNGCKSSDTCTNTNFLFNEPQFVAH